MRPQHQIRTKFKSCYGLAASRWMTRRAVFPYVFEFWKKSCPEIFPATTEGGKRHARNAVVPPSAGTKRDGARSATQIGQILVTARPARKMAKKLNSKKAFGANVDQYEHSSKELGGCTMQFSVIDPTPACESVDAKLPVIYWLSGLTCTDR